ncbi:MAG: MFS transporter [Deltaproteobacteria bacterium]|nr:MAG: MFS transporter [Deltaproteobacteria bacterium]
MPVHDSDEDVGNERFDPPDSSLFYGWVVVGSCTLLLFIAYGICYSSSVFFTSLQYEFSWNRATTSFLFSLYLLLIGFFSIIGGRTSDKYGPKIVVLMMGIITGLSLVLTSQIVSPWQLYFTYSILLSFGMGAMYVIVMSTGSRWFSRRRATALGIIGAGAGMGTVVLAPLNAWLIHSYHWRTAYLITGIIAWCTILPAALLLKKDPSEVGASIDGLPVSETIQLTDTKAAGGFSLQGAVQSRNFWLFCLVWFSYSFCLHLVMTHVVPRAEDTGITPIRAAVVLSVMQAVAIPSRLLAGFVADMVDKRTIGATFALIMAIAMLWLAAAENVWMFFMFAVTYGLAYGGLDPPVIALMADVFGLSNVGEIMGVLMISWGLGSATGPYIGGLVFDHTGGYELAFVFAGLVMTLAAFCMFRLKKQGP